MNIDVVAPTGGLIPADPLIAILKLTGRRRKGHDTQTFLSELDQVTTLGPKRRDGFVVVMMRKKALGEPEIIGCIDRFKRRALIP